MPFAVDPISAVAEGLTAILRGTKDPIHVITINGSSEGVVNTTNTTWEFAVVLIPGTNTFDIRATFGGLSSLIQTVVITVPVESETPDFWFGVLDRFGLIMALERNPGERNLSYRQRLLDVYQHIGNSSVNGLINAISRELGIKVEDDVFRVAAKGDGAGRKILTNPAIEFTQTGLLFSADQFLQEDVIQVESANLTAQLTATLATDVVEVFTLQGAGIPQEEFSVDDEGVVTFTSESFRGEWLRFSYRKKLSVDTWQQTLQQVVDNINAITLGGVQVFEATVTGDSAREAEGLTRRGRVEIASAAANSGWSPVIVRELWDPEFQERLLNSDATAFNTQLERWARQAQINTRIVWGLTILDVDTWDAETNNRPSGALPHLWDALARRWFAPGETPRFDAIEFMNYGGFNRAGTRALELEGFQQSDFHSGFSHEDDLKVDLVELAEG